LREVKKTILKANCNKCAKPQILLEIDISFNSTHLDYLINNNYIEGKSYTKMGILYIEDDNLVAIGPFGSNRLQIKCKTNSCDESLLILENILKNIP
jgi:hypothetical protein